MADKEKPQSSPEDIDHIDTPQKLFLLGEKCQEEIHAAERPLEEYSKELGQKINNPKVYLPWAPFEVSHGSLKLDLGGDGENISFKDVDVTTTDDWTATIIIKHMKGYESSMKVAKIDVIKWTMSPEQRNTVSEIAKFIISKTTEYKLRIEKEKMKLWGFLK